MQCGKFTVSAVQIHSYDIFNKVYFCIAYLLLSILSTSSRFVCIFSEIKWIIYRITRYLYQPLLWLSYFFLYLSLCAAAACILHANKFRCAAQWISLDINCEASIMQYLPFHYLLKSMKVMVKFAQYSVSCRHLRVEMLQSTNRLLCFGHKIFNRKYVDV